MKQKEGGESQIRNRQAIPRGCIAIWAITNLAIIFLCIFSCRTSVILRRKTEVIPVGSWVIGAQFSTKSDTILEDEAFSKQLGQPHPPSEEVCREMRKMWNPFARR
jgi:hypothetical protein